MKHAPLTATPEQIELAARVAHEANRHYCASIGDSSQLPWADAPEWQRESARLGVVGVAAGNGPGDSHASWLEHKRAEGWVFGAVKNPDLKQHPCMVPFAELPLEQRVKDVLFVNVVRGVLVALAGPK